jgi:DNA-binding transcriptional LysR family regulator
MDLNLFSLFVKVADAPSFAAAARQLGLRRSSVSRAVSTLEASHAFVLLRQLQYPAPLPKSRERPRVTGDDMLFCARAVKAGLGLGLLTTFVAAEDLAAGRLVRLLPKLSICPGALYFVHPPARHVARKVTAFRDYLVEYLRAHPIAG